MVSSKKIFVNLIWQFMEKSGTKIVSFIVSIILARLIAPADYGILAIIVAFLGLCDAFIIYGFWNALVQKKDADEIDFSTVFYTQMFTSFVIYAIIFFAAPFIAEFYGSGFEILTPTIRVLGLNVIVIASSSVQTALISRKMKFKLSFFATLSGTVLSAIIGIIMAVNGAGVWALVAQSLSSACINALILWIIAKWHPRLIFSFQRLKGLFGYGWKLLLVGLLENLYLEMRSLVIGKRYDSESLAHYNRGEQFPKIISVNINSSIKTVLFSAMSKEQDDLVALKKMTKRGIRTSSYLLFPFLVGLFVTADKLVPLILTDKWIPCVPYLRLFCLVYLFMPLQTTNMQVYKGVGKSGLSLILELIKKGIGIIGLLIAMPHGPYAIAVAFVITSIINTIVSAAPNKKIINYGLLEQIMDILPGLLLSLSFISPLWMIGKIPLHNAAILAIQIVVAVVIYLGLSILLKVESFVYMKNLLASFKKKKK